MNAGLYLLYTCHHIAKTYPLGKKGLTSKMGVAYYNVICNAHFTSKTFLAL